MESIVKHFLFSLSQVLQLNSAFRLNDVDRDPVFPEDHWARATVELWLDYIRAAALFHQGRCELKIVNDLERRLKRLLSNGR
jgi:hypothetical protein